MWQKVRGGVVSKTTVGTEFSNLAIIQLQVAVPAHFQRACTVRGTAVLEVGVAKCTLKQSEALILETRRLTGRTVDAVTLNYVGLDRGSKSLV